MLRRRIRTFIAVGGVVGLMAGATGLLAHTTWIQATEYNLAKPGPAKVFVNWGHHLPIDDPISHKHLNSIVLHTPDGTTQPLKIDKGTTYHPTQVMLPKPGSYVAACEVKPGYYTMYLDKAKKMHHHLGPMTDVAKDAAQVIFAVHFWQYGKALLNVGEGCDAVLKPIGHALEIVPDTHPAKLNPGDAFKFHVLKDGKPVQGAATMDVSYMGYSTGMDDFYIKRRALEGGRGSFDVSRAGVWYVRVKVREPAPDAEKAKCKALSYTATLTFQVNRPKPKAKGRPRGGHGR